MKKNCDNCGNGFETKRKDAKYCSNSCRTLAHRQRHNIAAPDFLQEKKKQNGLAEILDFSKGFGVVTKQLQENSAYFEQIRKIEFLERQRTIAHNEQARLASHYNAILRKNPALRAILVAAIGAVTLNKLANKKDKALFTILGAVGGGLLGLAIDDDPQNEKAFAQLQNLRQNAAQIENQIFTLDICIKQMRDELKTIPRYLSKEKAEAAQPTSIINLLPLLRKEPMPVGSKDTTEQYRSRTAQNTGILSSEQLATKEFKTWHFTGQWADFLGEPSHGFSVAIFGKPGHGKSTFAIKLAYYLAENQGKVLYISSEEGHSKTLQDKILRLNAQSNLLNIAEFKGLDDIKRQCKTYPFIVLDSVNNMNLSVENIESIKKSLSGQSLIIICQSTKNGDLRGSNEISHNADIVINIENMTASTNKNRFGKFAQMSF